MALPAAISAATAAGAPAGATASPSAPTTAPARGRGTGTAAGALAGGGAGVGQPTGRLSARRRRCRERTAARTSTAARRTREHGPGLRRRPADSRLAVVMHGVGRRKLQIGLHEPPGAATQPAPGRTATPPSTNRTGMRNRQLHAALAAFAEEAACQLSAETADGAEVPFEVVELAAGAATAPLYCYRPLTGGVHRRAPSALLGAAAELPARRARASAACGGLDAYLRRRGESRIPAEPRARAEHALRRLPHPRLRGVDRLRAVAPSAWRAPTRSSSRLVMDGPRADRGRRAAARPRDSSSRRGRARRRPDAGARRRARRGRAGRGACARRRATATRSCSRSPDLGGRARATRRRCATRRCACAGCSPRCACTTRAGIVARRAPPGRAPAARRGSRSRSAPAVAARAASASSPPEQEDELRAFCSLVAPPHAAQRRARVGAAPLRAGLRPRAPVRGADRRAAGAARAAGARGPADRAPGRRLARAVRAARASAPR